MKQRAARQARHLVFHHQRAVRRHPRQGGRRFPALSQVHDIDEALNELMTKIDANVGEGAAEELSIDVDHFTEGAGVLYGQRVRDLIAHAGRGLIRRLVDLRLCLAVTNGYAVVLAAGVRCIIGLHHSGIVDGFAVSGSIDYRNKSYRCAFLNAEITDLDGQNAGRFIVAVIVGQLAVQRAWIS